MKRLSVIAGLLIFLASAAPAQEQPPVIRSGEPVDSGPGPEARAWLERMGAHIGAPLELDQFVDGFFIGAKIRGTGHVLYLDERFFRAQQTLDSLFEGQPQPHTQSMLMVGDGETMWIEVRDSFIKVPVVKKVPLALLPQLSALSGVGFGRGDVHPLGQIKDLAFMANLNDVRVENEKVTLKGAMTEAAKWKLGEPFMGMEVKMLTLILDERTAFPITLRVDGESGLYLQYRYTNLVRPKREDVELERFRYELPANAELEELAAPDGGPQR